MFFSTEGPLKALNKYNNDQSSLPLYPCDTAIAVVPAPVPANPAPVPRPTPTPPTPVPTPTPPGGFLDVTGVGATSATNSACTPPLEYLAGRGGFGVFLNAIKVRS